jgi:hypothetical protein
LPVCFFGFLRFAFSHQLPQRFLPLTMTSTAPLSRLTIFFWTVLAFNLFQYLSIVFLVTDLWRHARITVASPAFYLYLLVFGVVLPGLLMYNARVLLREYFPAKRISQRLRIWTISICILQFLASVLSGASSLYILAILNTVPNDTMLAVCLMAISFLSAAVLNFITAIVLLRTMRATRKNYRDRPWESFESA